MRENDEKQVQCYIKETKKVTVAWTIRMVQEWKEKSGALTKTKRNCWKAWIGGMIILESQPTKWYTLHILTASIHARKLGRSERLCATYNRQRVYKAYAFSCANYSHVVVHNNTDTARWTYIKHSASFKMRVQMYPYFLRLKEEKTKQFQW